MASVAAHLIVGGREEPFLGALLDSLTGVAQTLIVNDNGPEPSVHASTFERSAFARRGALVVDRSPFVDFSQARNVCLRIHGELSAGDWVAFVDADEVHDVTAQRVARRLDEVPRDVDFVDGYTRHFFQAFDRYLSVERRMSFFRYASGVRWEGTVHERLRGLTGKRLPLPYVYAHYGHVYPALWQALKGRQYLGLGQPGNVLTEAELAQIDPRSFFGDYWGRLLHFHGAHPPAARQTIATLSQAYASQIELAHRLAAEAQPLATRMKNAASKANYEFRWRSRAFNPAARRLIAP